MCCPLRVKLQGSRIDDMTGGNSGVEPRVSLMYTQMVTQGGYSLEHFAGMVSSNAAKIMGMYPRKGALAVGSDADIVVLDTGLQKTIRALDLHETDYSPWEGHVVTVWPSVTVLRGKGDGGRRAILWRSERRVLAAQGGGRDLRTASSLKGSRRCPRTLHSARPICTS